MMTSTMTRRVAVQNHHVRSPRVSFRGALIAAIVLLAVIGPVVATCCSRDTSNWGCCGNGPCNIFCCNCDVGCNGACDCQPSDCLAPATVCSGSCAEPNSLACQACMGSASTQCIRIGCPTSRRRSADDPWSQVTQTCGGAHDDYLKRRDEFFSLVSKNKERINLDAFTDYVKKVAEEEHAGKRVGPGRKILEREVGEVMGIANAFMELDANKDGFIDRREFGF